MTILAELKRPLQNFVAISSDALQELIGLLIDLSSKGTIRKTDGGSLSIYDVIEKVVDKGNPREVWKRLLANNPHLSHHVTGCNFGKSSGHLETPVTDLAGIIEIIWLLPGDFSNKFRRLGAKVVSDAIAREYVDIRKFAEIRFPGYIDVTEMIISTQKALPPVTIHFTAPEWLDKNAPHLTRRQRICFFKEVAASHRFMVDRIPRKLRGKYIYSSKHEILFNRALQIAEEMIPAK